MGIKEQLLFLLFIQKTGYLTYNFFYSFFDKVSEGAIRVMLGRLKEESLVNQIIKRIHDQRFVYFSLSEAGKAYVVNTLDKFDNAYKWDGKWRVVVIINKKALSKDFFARNSLIKLDGSTYITFYRLSHSLDPKLGFVFETDHLQGYSNKQLAYFLWRLDRLEELYERVGICMQSKKGTQFVLESYLEAISQDPLLPHELLPVSWPAEKVRDKVIKLIQKRIEKIQA